MAAGNIIMVPLCARGSKGQATVVLHRGNGRQWGTKIDPLSERVPTAPLNRDRIRQCRLALCTDTTKKASVFAQGQVVICLCYLTLFPGWILQTGFVLFLARAPESHDDALRAGCSDCAVRLTRSADHELFRSARLRADQLALSAVPDLARGAKLLDDWSRAGRRGDWFRTGSGDAGAVFGSRFPRRARLAMSAFAELGVALGCGRLYLDRLSRRRLARSACTNFPVKVMINRRRSLLLGCSAVFGGRRIGLALHVERVAVGCSGFDISRRQLCWMRQVRTRCGGIAGRVLLLISLLLISLLLIALLLIALLLLALLLFPLLLIALLLLALLLFSLLLISLLLFPLLLLALLLFSLLLFSLLLFSLLLFSLLLFSLLLVSLLLLAFLLFSLLLFSLLLFLLLIGLPKHHLRRDAQSKRKHQHGGCLTDLPKCGSVYRKKNGLMRQTLGHSFRLHSAGSPSLKNPAP